VIGGVATIGVALLWMTLFPGLRDARSLEREEQTPTTASA